MPLAALLSVAATALPALGSSASSGSDDGKRRGRVNGCSRDGAFKWRKRSYLATYSVCLDQPFIAGAFRLSDGVFGWQPSRWLSRTAGMTT